MFSNLVVERIAILGWGSLLWDRGTNFDAFHGPWIDGGPSLSIEFSRVSGSRSGALTLVLDEDHGSLTQVSYCLSTRSVLGEAIEDLRCREGTVARRIGFVTRSDESRSRSPSVKDAILAWMGNSSLGAVIWTDLPSNFQESTGLPFSVEVALEYLSGLDADGKRLAQEYIDRAPAYVDTPVRRAWVEINGKKR